MRRKKPLPVFTMLIHYTCLAPIVVVAALNIFYPPVKIADPAPYQWIFFVLFLVAFGTLPLLGGIDRYFLNWVKLKEQARKGIATALIHLKTGLIAAASTTAFVAFLGATDYLVNRQITHLLVFLGFWFFEYLLILYWLKRGDEDIRRIIASRKRKLKKKVKRPTRSEKVLRSGANR